MKGVSVFENVIAAIENMEAAERTLAGTRDYNVMEVITKACDGLDIMIEEFGAVRYYTVIKEGSHDLSIFIAMPSVSFGTGTIGSDYWKMFNVLINADIVNLTISEDKKIVAEFVFGGIWKE